MKTTTAPLTDAQAERLYRTLLELWGKKYGVDLELVSITTTNAPTQIIMED